MISEKATKVPMVVESYYTIEIPLRQDNCIRTDYKNNTPFLLDDANRILRHSD